jgi:RNA polymerase sigma-70 factor (ECF subfamily)
LKTESADQDLILCRRCQRGDVHALEELYKRHKDKVYALALRLTNNAQDAEDIVQDVFVQVYRKIKDFREEAAFTSWLYRVATNIALSALRRRKSRWGVEKGPSPGQPEEGRHVETGKILRPFLEEAIAELPPRARMIFVLHDIQGFQHNEIAEMLDCSEGTSKSQLHKARARLRKLLRPRLNMIADLTDVMLEKA